LKNVSRFEHLHSKYAKSANATCILLFQEHLKNQAIFLPLANFWLKNAFALSATF
jgi:hypothetical protein